MNKENYDKQMQEEINAHRGEALPRLLLHACCAPCSSACLERLRQDFLITVFYYNPNIDEEAEYRKRAAEERRLIEELNRQVRERDYTGMLFGQDVKPGESEPQLISVMEGPYRPDDFYEAARGLEAEPEGGARCTACFHLRLNETARIAKEQNFDYFTTTLTISPLKDAERLNRIGEAAGKTHGVRWLSSDFKKREGYKRSIELSKKFDLYRQDSCGCSFSKKEPPLPIN